MQTILPAMKLSVLDLEIATRDLGYLQCTWGKFMVCVITQIHRFMRLIFFDSFFILSAELFIIFRRFFSLEVKFYRWMLINAIFTWKRDYRMGYVRILATIRYIKTLTSCAWLPFRFPVKCWPQIRKNPQRNYYRTTLDGERRVPKPCNASMYNPWMYNHVKCGCHVQAASEKNARHLRDNRS